MSCLTLERARELISSFDGPFIIAMHRRGDNINGYFEDILEYIKSDKDKKYNMIELDVSNMPELCAEHYIVTPCIALFLNGKKEYSFGTFASVSYIEAMTSMICGDNTTMRIQPFTRVRLNEEGEDEEEEFEIDF